MLLSLLLMVYLHPSYEYKPIVSICALSTCLVNLLDRVQTLENQSLPQGYVGKPAYDSGWHNISQGEDIDFKHNLNTTNYVVYVVGDPGYGTGIGQFFFGGDKHGIINRGLSWGYGTNTTMRVMRQPDDGHWSKVRVMIWKIAEP